MINREAYDHFSSMKLLPLLIAPLIAIFLLGCQHFGTSSSAWVVDSEAEWLAHKADAGAIDFSAGVAHPTSGTAFYRSQLKRFPEKVAAARLTVQQSPKWLNWEHSDPIGPDNLGDAPVFLALGPDDYWMFGRYDTRNMPEGESGAPATLEGFDIPLKTTVWANQFDAPGGLKPGKGGYHAWQSRDMVNWVHHGPVTEHFSRWVTSAEYIDGKAYIYYDFPNDQDPHLYIDADLTDGEPGQNMGLAFKDPSDGSDCAVIRGLDGKFYMVSEDWSPINARKHSWDSPLASLAVSEDGKGGFKLLDPPVDHRTEPTGEFAEFQHPHWTREDPENFTSDMSRYEIHEPEQDAFGDWAAISIGGQYYLFGDFHPAGTTERSEMSVAMFTSSDLQAPFEYFYEIGQGHPDPEIGFAEGKFYLMTQTEHDYVSPGPWVETVEARVGADTDNDGEIDVWTDWQEIKERYEYVEGFAKQVERIPAALALDDLPEAYGFAFELRLTDSTENISEPTLDRVTLEFK